MIRSTKHDWLLTTLPELAYLAERSGFPATSQAIENALNVFELEVYSVETPLGNKKNQQNEYEDVKVLKLIRFNETE